MAKDNSKPRVMIMDIEATNLKADFGFVLCIAWKWSGEDKIYSVSIADAPSFKKDCTNDKWIIEEFRKAAEQADAIVMHYGSVFDYPYLQARALAHGLPLLPKVPYIDTWRIARKGLALSSNRLASLSRLLGVEEKTPLSGRIWVKATSGDAKSIKYIVEHCKQDVRVLEQVYDRIKGLRFDNPRLSGDGCPTCGSYDIISRGRVRTTKQIMHKFSCNNCGHWFSRRNA